MMNQHFRLRKRTLVTVVLAALFSATMGFGGMALAEDKIIIKVPNDNSPVTPNTQGWEVFQKYVNSRLGNKYEIQIFWGAQLGDSQKTMEAAKMGVYKIVQHDNGICGAYAPMSVWQIPYLFSDEVVFREYLKSNAFQDINNQMAKELGIRIISATPYGFYCMLNKVRPVTKLEDMKGLKMRSLPGSEIEIVAMKALGISPTPTSWGEIYTSIKTGVIDGLPHAMMALDYLKAYEVAKYLTLDYSFSGASTVTVNEKWWQSLSKEEKKVFQTAANLNASVEMGGCIHNNNLVYLKQFEEKGVMVTTLKPEEKARIKETAQKAALEFVTKKVGADLVEKTMRTIKDIEARLYGN